MSARWCVAPVLVLAGCLETIALGYECPDQLDSCVDAARDGGARGASPAPTGSIPVADASTVDAGTRSQPGAAADASVEGQFPRLENASFEAPIPEADGALLDTNRIPPWRACDISWLLVSSAFVQRPGGTRDIELQPTDGSYFLESVVSSREPQAPLYQQLEAPLARGRYALRVDVQTANDADISVALWTGPACDPSRRLDVSARILPGRWQQVCLSFEVAAGMTVETLMLAATSGTSEMSGTRVYYDNLRAMDGARPDPDCL